MILGHQFSMTCGLYRPDRQVTLCCWLMSGFESPSILWILVMTHIDLGQGWSRSKLTCQKQLVMFLISHFVTFFILPTCINSYGFSIFQDPPFSPYSCVSDDLTENKVVELPVPSMNIDGFKEDEMALGMAPYLPQRPRLVWYTIQV